MFNYFKHYKQLTLPRDYYFTAFLKARLPCSQGKSKIGWFEEGFLITSSKFFKLIKTVNNDITPQLLTCFSNGAHVFSLYESYKPILHREHCFQLLDFTYMWVESLANGHYLSYPTEFPIPFF